MGSDGFSYTEVLVATFLVALLLVPAIDALYSGIRGGESHAAQAVQHAHLSGRMETVLAQPFEALQREADLAGGPGVTVAAFSDAAGAMPRALVYLARYDGDNADGDDNPFSGVDDGLLWVRVAIEDTPDALETLVAH